jgi:hypothetical protein
LLQRNLGRTEEGVGFVHRGDVVGDHAAVAGGGDVGGLYGNHGSFETRNRRHL